MRQHGELNTGHGIMWNDNINVFTNFVLTLYKHEVCNIKHAIKTSEACNIEGLNLKRFYWS
jgi:hypothetical protein